MKSSLTRRRFLAGTALAGLGISSSVAGPEKGRRSLFDAKTLKGWKPMPRLALPRDPRFADLPPDELKAAVLKFYQDQPDKKEMVEHVGRWEVVDGAIVGGHAPPESLHGAYLVSEEKFGDFELELEARPDWPADTGIMIRANELGSVGFQVLVDHRPKGCIGGVYGNSIGGFLVAPFAMTGDKLPGYRVANLRSSPVESIFEMPKPEFGASFDDFLRTWKVNDWNHFRIRCTGQLPVISTWINGARICELDTAKIRSKAFDPQVVAKRLGADGHIAFEVHDVSLKNPLGYDRWAPGAVCRWRNIFIMEL